MGVLTRSYTACTLLQAVIPKTVKTLIRVTYPRRITNTWIVPILSRIGSRYSTHPVARNEVEGGSTKKDVNPPTHLTEPQGKIKI